MNLSQNYTITKAETEYEKTKFKIGQARLRNSERFLDDTSLESHIDKEIRDIDWSLLFPFSAEIRAIIKTIIK